LSKAKYDVFEQFDISFQTYGFSRHELIMARIFTSLLNLEPIRNGLHPVGSSKSFHFRGSIKQGYTSIGSQQTGVSVDERIYAKSRGEIGATPEQGWRR
jgi:hypothetical protein